MLFISKQVSMSKEFTGAFMQALLSALLVVVLLATMYFMVEPQVGRAVSGTPFSVRQEIGAEISFLVQAANVSMTGPLNGLTGGNATGTTQAVVRANSGYYVEIAFSDSDVDGIMMRREGGGSNAGSIRNYATSTTMTEPTYGFSSASTSAVFAYTVTASDTLAVDQSFLNNGAVCNAGSGTDVDTCWMKPQTSGFRIMNSTDPAPTGSTTTVKFRVYIPSSPTPGVDSGFYTATATLSAFTQ
jgi:hypothetical protein